jgi:hypothetical protein
MNEKLSFYREAYLVKRRSSSAEKFNPFLKQLETIPYASHFTNHAIPLLFLLSFSAPI